MKVLIPLLPGQAFDKEFTNQASEGAKEVFILAVIDSDLMRDSSGQEMGSIASFEEVAEEMVKHLRKKRVTADYSVEWGSLPDNVVKRAKQRESDKIVVQRLPVSFFKKFADQVRENCKTELVVV